MMKKVTFDDIPKLARNESLFTDTVYAQSILEHEDSDNFNFLNMKLLFLCNLSVSGYNLVYLLTNIQ